MTTAGRNGSTPLADTGADTHRARVRAREEDTSSSTAENARKRQAVALDLRAQGKSFDQIAAVCGYTHRSAARKAVAAARIAIAEDTAEEARLNFKASYGPLREVLHRKARRGDVRAAEVLVKLDERESRLFGLDLTPDAAMLNVQYTKRIVLETTLETPAQLPAPESEPGA